jgi:hypothetical protein
MTLDVVVMVIVKEEIAVDTATDQQSVSTVNKKDTNHLNVLNQRRNVKVVTNVVVTEVVIEVQ